jgi:hypothetical protein
MLPANTAFFVKANNNTNLNFTEQTKNVCSSCPTVFSLPQGSASLSFSIQQGGLTYDNLTINASNQFSNQKDEKDADKLLNEGISIYALSTNNAKLAANYVNDDSKAIPLGISLPKSAGKQSFRIEVDNFTNPAGIEWTLIDHYTGARVVLGKGSSYNLTIDPNDTAQTGDNRLQILMKK